MFEDLMINRCVHTRALEGDGEKPSRHDNEGPFFLLSVYFGCAMGVSQRPGSQKSKNSKVSNTFRMCEKARNALLDISTYT